MTANARAITGMVMAMGVFVLGESLSKLAFASVPMFQVLLLRCILGTGLCLVAVLAMGDGKALRHAFHPFVLGRSILEVGANTFYAFAIFYMPIGDVTAIIQIAPLLVLLGARLIYGETLGSLRLFFILVGFCGALLVAQPGTGSASPYAVFGFVIAAFVAARDLMTRKVPGHIPAPVATTSVMAALTLAAAIGMLVSSQPPVMPDFRDFTLIVVSGALMAAGHFAVFFAYRFGEARAIAPFMYSLTLWALFIGYALFGDVPNSLSIIGIGLILVSGLLVIMSEKWSTGSR
jgi:drug/metabolite transporter (DMT)-like permease